MGISIDPSGVTTRIKVNDGLIAAMKFVPGGGRGIAGLVGVVAFVLDMMRKDGSDRKNGWRRVPSENYIQNEDDTIGV